MFKKLLLTLVILISFLTNSFSAKYYWVGGSGKWTDFKNHWATSSGGTSFHKLVPTALDETFFDANSFSAASQSVTVDSEAYCKNIDFTGVLKSPTFIVSLPLNIYGNAIFSSGMTLNGKSDVIFAGLNAGNTIKTNGLVIQTNVRIDGTGSFELVDNFTQSGKENNFLIRQGTFFSKSKSISTYKFRVYNSATKNIFLGSSYIRCYHFEDTNTVSVKFSSDTATFELTADDSYLFTEENLKFGKVLFINNYGSKAIIFGKGKPSFGKLTFKGNGQILTSCTFDSLEFTPKKDYYFQNGSTQTIKTNWQGSGNCAGYVKIGSTKVGTQFTISKASGSVGLSYVLLSDCKSTGGASFSATNSINQGNNTGWTITGQSPKRLYYIGKTSNWSNSSNWSLTSGGSSSGCVPNDSDDVYFDGKSFTSNGQVLTLDDEGRCRRFDWSGLSYKVTLKSDTTLYVNRSFILHNKLSLNGLGKDTFQLSTNYKLDTIDLNGADLAARINIKAGGSYQLTDSFINYYNPTYFKVGALRLIRGGLYTKGFNLKTYNVDAYVKNTFTLDCSNSIWTTYTFNVFNVGGSGVFNFNSPNSTFKLFGGASVYTHFPLKFYDIIGLDPNAYIYLQGLNNTTIAKYTIHYFNTVSNIYLNGCPFFIDSLKLYGGNTNYFPQSQKTTIKSWFEAKGDCKNYISLLSTYTSFQAEIVKTSGTIVLDYCRIKDCKFSGGATWTATNSSNVSNSTGISFTSGAGKNYYWIKGTGNWSDTAHWSLTSGGKIAGCLPSDSDNVFFDANSFTSSSSKVVTLDVSSGWKNMDWTGSKFKPEFYTSYNNYNIGGSLKFISAMTVTGYGYGAFTSNSTGNTITTAGQKFPSYITFDGKGDWTLSDSFTTYLTPAFRPGIFLQQGTLYTNGNTIRVGFYVSNPSTAKTAKVDFSNSLVYLDYYYITNTSYSHITTNSKFYINSNNALIWTANPMTFNFVEILYPNSIYSYTYSNSTTANTYKYLRLNSNFIFYGANSIDTLDLTAGKKYFFEDGKRQTINGSVKTFGNCSYMTLTTLYNTGPKGDIYKSSGNVTLTNARLKNMRGLGLAKFYANSSYDLGGNVTWNFTAAIPKTFYWIGGKGSWLDGNHWSFTSGGSSSGCYPNDSDDVNFDSLSFVANGDSVIIDSAISFRNMKWQNLKYKVSLENKTVFTVNGSLELHKNLKINQKQPIRLTSNRPSSVLATGSVLIPDSLMFIGKGTYTLKDSLLLNQSSLSGVIKHISGNIIANKNKIKAYKYLASPTNTKTFDFSKSKLYFNFFYDSLGSSLTLKSDSSNIYITDKAGDFSVLTGRTFYNLSFIDKLGSGTIIGNSNLTFNALRFFGDALIKTGTTTDTFICAPGNTYKFQQGKTFIFQKYLYVNGTSTGLTYLGSNVSNKRAYFYKPSVDVCAELIYVKDIEASGVNWTAGNASIDLGNNKGWTFNRLYSCLPRSIATSSISANNWCPGDKLKITYIKSGNFNANNNFFAQLSDSTGSFLKPDTCGYVSSSGEDTIYAQIPYSIIGGGSKYRFRVVSDGPQIFGTDNGTDKSIKLGLPKLAKMDTSLCIGSSLNTGYSSVSNVSYSWKSTPVGFTSTKSSDLVKPSGTISYTVLGILSTSGCKRPDTINVSVNKLPIVLTGGNKTICLGDSVVMGDTSAKHYGYQWSLKSVILGAKSYQTISPIVSNFYTLSVYDSITKCANNDSLFISINGKPIVNAGNDTSICQGKTLSIGKAAISGNSYVWKDLLSGAKYSTSIISITPLSTRNYRLIITNSSGCKDSDEVLISVISSPIINLGKDVSICKNDIFTSNNLTSSSLLWSWKSNSSTLPDTSKNINFKVLSTTTLILFGKDKIAGCSSSDTQIVTMKPLPTLNTGGNKSICLGDSVFIGSSTPNSKQKYTWTKGGVVVSSKSGFIVKPIILTNYKLNVYDSTTTCQNNDSIKVDLNLKPIVNAGKDTTICKLQTAILGKSVVSGFTYVWKDLISGTKYTSSTISVSPNSTRNYRLIITNSSGCKDSDEVNVKVNSLPSVSLGKDVNVCSGNSFTTNNVSTGALNWSWKKDGVSTLDTTKNIGFVVSANTTLILFGKDKSTGCLNSDTQNVNMLSLPVVNTGGNKIICPGDSVFIGSSTSKLKQKYTWTKGGVVVSSKSGFLVKPITLTYYKLNVYDSTTTCQNNDSIKVDLNLKPIVNAGKDTTICKFQTAVLGKSAVSGFSYVWKDLIVGTKYTSSTISVSPTSTRNYRLIITNSSGCKDSDEVNVKVNSLPSVSLGKDVNVCSGNSFTTNNVSTGALNWSWKKDGVSTLDTTKNIGFVVSANTTLILFGKDKSTGCLNSDTQNVNMLSLPAVNTGGNKIICPGDSVFIGSSTPNSKQKYTWTKGGVVVSSKSGFLVKPITLTNYKLNVYDSTTTCQNNDSIKVDLNLKPIVNAGNDTTICRLQTAILGKSAVSGFSYVWKDLISGTKYTSSTISVSPTSTRNYRLIITNSSGCKDSDEVNVKVNSLPVVSLGKDVNVCSGNSFTTNNVSAGALNWSWKKDGVSTLDTTKNIGFVVSANTTLILFGKDKSTGCLNSDTQNVNMLSLPVVNTGGNKIICPGDSVFIGSSTSNLKQKYTWTRAAVVVSSKSGFIVKPITLTYYKLNVYDSTTTCKNNDSIKVDVNAKSLADAGKDTAICFGNSITLGGSAISGYSYTWIELSTGKKYSTSNIIVSPKISTDYRLIIANTTGCKDSDEVTIGVNSLPKVILGSDVGICKGNIFTSNNVSPAGINWSWKKDGAIIGDTTKNISFTVNSNATIISFGSNKLTGCLNSDTQNVSVKALPTISTGGNKTICQSDSVFIGSSPKIKTSYLWKVSGSLISKKSGFYVHPSIPTIYQLTVYDSASTCSITDSITVNVNVNPSFSLSNDTSICLKQSLSIGEVSVSGFSYLWNTGSTTSQILVNPKSKTIFKLTKTNTLTGCKSIDSVIVNIYSLPNPYAGLDSQVCYNSTFSRLGKGGNGSKFYWFNLSTTSVVSTNQLLKSIGSINSTYVLNEKDTITGCENQDTLTVIVNSLPAYSKLSDTTFCFGNLYSRSLKTSNGNKINWKIGSGATFSGNPLKFVPISSDTVQYTIQDSITTCSISDKFYLKLNANPLKRYLKDTSICYGESIHLIIPQISGNILKWNESGSVVSNSNEYRDKVLKTKTIQLMETEGITGCYTLDTFTIKSNSLPIANAGMDVNICPTQNGKLSASNYSHYGYFWKSKDTSASFITREMEIVTSKQLTFGLTVTDSLTGCKNYDTASINIFPSFAVNKGIGGVLCTNDSFQLGSSFVSGNSYSWISSPSGFTSSISNPVVKPTFTTNYILNQKVIATGCIRTDSITIVVNPLPTITSIPDKKVCYKDSLSIGVINYDSLNKYSFTDLNTSSLISSVPFWVNKSLVSEKIQLSATVKSTGCVNKDTFNYIVNPLPIVQIFTRDSICKNDILLAYTNDTSKSYFWTSNGKFINKKDSIYISPSGLGSLNIGLKLTNSFLCSDSSSKIVKILNTPISKINGDSEVCYGTVSKYEILGNHNSFIIDSIKGGILKSINKDTVVIEWVGKVGQIYLNLNNIQGCFDYISKSVTIHDKPVAAIIGNNTICEGSSLIIKANSNAGTNSYSWNTNGSLKRLSPNGDSISLVYNNLVSKGRDSIILITSNMFGCGDTSSKVITIFQKPNLSLNTIKYDYCLGDSINIFGKILKLSKIAFSTKGSILGSTDSSIALKYSISGKDTVLGIETSINGCLDTASLVIYNHSNPIAKITGRDTICLNSFENYTSDSIAITKYTWSYSGTGTAIIKSDSLKISYGISGNQTITLKVADKFSCSNTVSKDIYVNPEIIDTFGLSSNSCEGSLFIATYIGKNSHNWIPNINLNLVSGTKTSDSLGITSSKIGKDSLGILLIDKFGCSITKYKTFSINSNPIISLSGRTQYCAPDSLKLSENDTSLKSVWNYNSLVVNNNLFKTYLKDTSLPKIISLKVINSKGCYKDSSIKIVINPSPMAKITGRDTICLDASDLYLGDTNYISNIKWSYSGSPKIYSNLDSLSILYNSAGSQTIGLKVSNTFGCADSVSKSIYVQSLPFDSFKISNVRCEKTDLSVNYNGKYNHQWLISKSFNISKGNSLSDTLILSRPLAGKDTLTILITDKFGCNNRIKEGLYINSKPMPKISGSFKLCTPNNLILTQNDTSLNTVWNYTKALNSFNLNENILSDSSKNTVSLSVIDSNSCTYDSTIKLTLFNSPMPSKIRDSSICYSINQEILPIINGSQTRKGLVWKVNNVFVGKSTIEYKDLSQGKNSIVYNYLDSNGCSTKDSFNYLRFNKIFIDIKFPKVVCEADKSVKVEADITSTKSGAINWVANYPIAPVQQKGYREFSNITANKPLKVDLQISADGCGFDTTFTISSNKNPVPNFRTKDLCFGDTLNLVFLDNSVNKIFYTLDGKVLDFNVEKVFKGNKIGSSILNFVVENDKGCRDSITKSLLTRPLPSAKFGLKILDANEVTFLPENITNLVNSTFTLDKSYFYESFTNFNYSFERFGTHFGNRKVKDEFGCESSFDTTFDIIKVYNNRLKVYPNPFVEYFNVKFEIQEPTRVRMELFDMTGRMIKVLLDKNITKGLYNENFDFTTIPATDGVYHLRTYFNDRLDNIRLIRSR